MHPQQAKDCLDRGRHCLELGSYAIALHWFDQAIAIEPQLIEAWEKKAETLRKLNRYDEANAAFEKAIEIRSMTLIKPEATDNDARSLEYFENLAATLRDLGCFEEAIEIRTNIREPNAEVRLQQNNQHCEEESEIYDYTKYSDAGFWFIQSYQQYLAGNFEGAIASIDSALRYKPDFCEAWNARGVALKMLERYEDAIASYDLALHYEPDLHVVWDNRGNALKALGRYEEAIASYDSALCHKPDSHQAWNGRGDALVDLGQYEDAITSYDSALHYKPDSHGTWNNRGIALWNLGRHKDAIASYDSALRYKPDLHEAWGNRGTALFDLERYEDAIASYDSALRYKPDSHGSWNNRGNSVLKSDGRGKTPLALSLPPAMQNQDLDKRGYEGRLASIREGFKYVAQETEGWGLVS